MFLVAANTRQALVGQKEWITTGSSGIQVQFLFSDDWEGLSKFAVFRNAEIEESKIPIALPESNLTELPAENCAAEYVDEKVYVGVYGSDGLGHIIIPTIWVSLGVLKEGAAYEGMDPPQPTQDMWAQILAIAQNAGAENAEEAEKAADEAKTAVTHYPKIVNGYWYVWNAETETWVNTEIRAEGRDGTSPTVTVTDIEGGHRVTITDEDHPQGQTFDVMDGQGGGTGDYDELTNRPRINGHTLTGNQSASDLGLGTYSKPSSGIPKTDLASDVQASLGKADTALQTAPVQSVAGKTGAVNLGAGDVGFSSSEEYNEGTVGAKLSDLNRQLSDNRITTLDTTALAGARIVEAVGNPVYVDDVTDYPAYNLTDTGWYVFARITAPKGKTAGGGTTVTGAAGAIITSGAAYIDVAVRFEVAAVSQEVTINWGTETETFVFKATDLAIRNLDYRVTFYVYDISPFCSWTYELTTDTTFGSGKYYYTKDENDEYTLAEVTVGETVPADTYYVHAGLTIEGMTRNVTYQCPTPVDCPVEFVLPAIEDETHGAWFECRFRFMGAYSITLTVPTGVKVATEHTQKEKAGINMVDLHYTNIDDVKLWRFLNTASSIPA